MASYKTVFGTYLKTEDLQGRVINVQIENVTIETMKDNDTGQNERKLVAHFTGKDKGLILNRTNADALGAIFGTDDIDHWRGPVQLFVDPNVRFGNRTVPGLRVRAVSYQAPAPQQYQAPAPQQQRMPAAPAYVPPPMRPTGPAPVQQTSQPDSFSSDDFPQQVADHGARDGVVSDEDIPF